MQEEGGLPYPPVTRTNAISGKAGCNLGTGVSVTGVSVTGLSCSTQSCTVNTEIQTEK